MTFRVNLFGELRVLYFDPVSIFFNFDFFPRPCLISVVHVGVMRFISHCVFTVDCRMIAVVHMVICGCKGPGITLYSL